MWNTAAVSCPLTLSTAISTQSSYLYWLYCKLQWYFFSLAIIELKTCIKAPIDRQFINSSFPNESEVVTSCSATVSSFDFKSKASAKKKKPTTFVWKNFLFLKFVCQITYSRWVFISFLDYLLKTWLIAIGNLIDAWIMDTFLLSLLF